MTPVALREADQPVARSRAQWLECLGVHEEELADYRKGRRALSQARIQRLPDAHAAGWLDRDFIAAFEAGPEDYHAVRLTLLARVADERAAAKLKSAYAPRVGEFTYGYPKADARDLLALELLTLRQFEADGHIGIRLRYHAHWVVRQLLDYLAHVSSAFAPSATAVSALVMDHHFADRREFEASPTRLDWGPIGQPTQREIEQLYTPAWRDCAPLACTAFVAPGLRTARDAPQPIGASVATGARRARVPDRRLIHSPASVDGRCANTGQLPAIGVTLRRAADAALVALVAAGRCASSGEFWRAVYCDRHRRRQTAATRSRISPARLGLIEARYPEVARWLRRPLIDAAERRRKRLFENAAAILRRAGERRVERSLLWLANCDPRLQDPIDALAFALLRMDAAAAVRHWISFSGARHRLDEALERLETEAPFQLIAAAFTTYVDARFADEQRDAQAALGGEVTRRRRSSERSLD